MHLSTMFQVTERIVLTRIPLSSGRELSVEILDASESMVDCMGNAAAMVHQARLIARASRSVVHRIKLEAEAQKDDDSKTKLLSAAEQLTYATSGMIEHAKTVAKNPLDESYMHALKQVGNHGIPSLWPLKILVFLILRLQVNTIRQDTH